MHSSRDGSTDSNRQQYTGSYTLKHEFVQRLCTSTTSPTQSPRHYRQLQQPHGRSTTSSRHSKGTSPLSHTPHGSKQSTGSYHEQSSTTSQQKIHQSNDNDMDERGRIGPAPTSGLDNGSTLQTLHLIMASPQHLHDTSQPQQHHAGYTASSCARSIKAAYAQASS